MKFISDVPILRRSAGIGVAMLDVLLVAAVAIAALVRTNGRACHGTARSGHSGTPATANLMPEDTADNGADYTTRRIAVTTAGISHSLSLRPTVAISLPHDGVN